MEPFQVGFSDFKISIHGSSMYLGALWELISFCFWITFSCMNVPSFIYLVIAIKKSHYWQHWFFKLISTGLVLGFLLRWVPWAWRVGRSGHPGMQPSPLSSLWCLLDKNRKCFIQVIMSITTRWAGKWNCVLGCSDFMLFSLACLSLCLCWVFLPSSYSGKKTDPDTL